MLLEVADPGSPRRPLQMLALGGSWDLSPPLAGCALARCPLVLPAALWPCLLPSGGGNAPLEPLSGTSARPSPGAKAHPQREINMF